MTNGSTTRLSTRTTGIFPRTTTISTRTNTSRRIPRGGPEVVTEGGATMYRRVKEDVTGTSFAAAAGIEYIIADHETRKVV